ncbi:MAG: hypothetical protein KF859_10215 [Phycisphaeraceae bacterium]|nr:hypothetical protein [Phycisphaeraceae bacterium]
MKRCVSLLFRQARRRKSLRAIYASSVSPNEIPLNHHRQDYCTRKDRSLNTVSDARHTYAKKGKYTVYVKLVDVFGCDPSTTVVVKV